MIMKLLSAICLFAFVQSANDIEQIHQELQKNQHAIQELDRSPAFIREKICTSVHRSAK